MIKLFTLILLSSLIVSASETCSTNVGAETVESKLEIKTDVPKFLEGAVIIVRTKDGKETQVPAEKFKVVPRKQQFIVNKTKQLTEVVCKNANEKNRVSALVGRGLQNGLDTKIAPASASVENNVGAVVGAQYQRLVTEKVSLGIQAQSNKTLMFNVGFDF